MLFIAQFLVSLHAFYQELGICVCAFYFLEVGFFSIRLMLHKPDFMGKKGDMCPFMPTPTLL